MKKKIILFVIVCFSGFSVNAQFLYSIGIAGGVSYGTEKWNHEQWSTNENYIFGLNGALLAEFSDNPNFKWRSEFMYNQLGTREDVQGVSHINQTNYLSFNNYLKCCYPLFNFIPYVLIGPRVEYLLTRGAAVFPDAIAGMYSFHLSGAVGIGVEKICFGRIKPFVEFFYNRDIMPSFSGHVASNDPYPPLAGTTLAERINSHDFELRIGIKYVFKGTPQCPHVDNSAGNPPGAQ